MINEAYSLKPHKNVELKQKMPEPILFLTSLRMSSKHLLRQWWHACNRSPLQNKRGMMLQAGTWASAKTETYW